MRVTLLILLILVVVTSSATAQELCFTAEQGGREVTVICASQEVKFFNCSVPTPAGSTVLFFPGPKDQVDDNSRTFGEGEPYMFPDPGEFYVTLILNRGERDEDGQTITELHERKFEVKTTPDPTFEVTVCANKEAVVTITDQQYDTYAIDFNDGSQPINAFKGDTKTHTYTANGPYSVSVTGSHATAACASRKVTLQVEQPQPFIPPVINQLQVIEQHATAGSIFFNFDNLLGGYTYTLSQRQEGENNFTPVTAIAPNQLTYALNNINTTIAAAYKLDVRDNCGNDLPGSNIASSIVLNVTPENGFNLVQWQSAETLQETEIYRNGNLLPLNNPTSPYRDTDITCGGNYVYEVRGRAADGSSTSISHAQRVTTSSTIRPPVGTLLVTYNLNNHVEVRFTAPDGETVQEVNFYRRFKGASSNPLTTVFNTTELVDELSEPVEVCYSATFKNECALSEMSQAVCPILLTGEQSLNSAFVLNWSAYEGFPEGIAGYTVDLLDENNQLIDSYPATGTTYTHTNASNEMQPLRYRIKATSNSGAITYSNLVQAEQVVQLHIPSGFTPNGDGLNDVFEVKGRFIEGYEIRIYNSMGQVVFTSANRQESWDGTFKGNPLPAGAYAYEVIVTTESGKLKQRTGTVTLLR